MGEGIVSTAGSQNSWGGFDPDLISQTVLSKGLDAGTALRSIDRHHGDVGRNIGAL